MRNCISNFIKAAAALAVMFALTTTTMAQFPTASDEHKVLKKEEGKWDAKITMLYGPAGPFEEPMVSEGKESNRMIGDFWIVSDFSGNFSGMEFNGHAQFGYDAEKEKYFGTWVDSFSPNITKMVGTYDEETKTMTYESSGTGMDGNPSKGKNVVFYESDDKRTMTMYMQIPGQDEMVKAMVIEYTRAK